MNYAKQPTFRSEAWLRAVASLPCVQCGRTDVQAAHRNEGKALGKKTDDCLTAALCVACHSMIDQGAQLTRDMRRDMIDEAIIRTIVQLAREGLIRVI